MTFHRIVRGKYTLIQEIIHKEVMFSSTIKYNGNEYNKLLIDPQCTSTLCQTYKIELTPSSYKIELWGSQGGTATYAAQPGNGSYVCGILMVSKASTIYAYIGNRKGFNGGGNGGQGQNSGANGGGCTDIRLEGNGIGQRIMVAAGGGGGGGYSNSGTPNNRTRVSGGSGGNGDSNAYSYSTSTQWGMPGKKGENVYTSNGGIAGKYSSSSSSTDGTYYPSGGGGGGGGYFGGGGGGSGCTTGGSYNRNGSAGSAGTQGTGGNGGSATYTISVAAYYSYPSGGGGGGSSFIDARIIPLEMINGSSLMKDINENNEIGNTRDGAVRITDLKHKMKLPSKEYRCLINNYKKTLLD